MAMKFQPNFLKNSLLNLYLPVILLPKPNSLSFLKFIIKLNFIVNCLQFGFKLLINFVKLYQCCRCWY